jgi:hypothetical protein
MTAQIANGTVVRWTHRGPAGETHYVGTVRGSRLDDRTDFLPSGFTRRQNPRFYEVETAAGTRWPPASIVEAQNPDAPRAEAVADASVLRGGAS